MPDESWDGLVERVREGELEAALMRVRARAAKRRSVRATRWRVLGLAAAFVLTFGAGLLAGRATAPARAATRMWAVGAGSMQASRGSFIAVPAGRAR